MKRHYKKNRAQPKSPYDTYSYWYDKYTKGDKAGWFAPKLKKEEFDKQYDMAKKAKVPNPAKSVAQSQEYVDRTFEKQYKKMYGKNMGDIRDKNARIDMFDQFVQDCMDRGMSYDEGRSEFEKYFY